MELPRARSGTFPDVHAVIFDLDGTLLDSFSAHFEAYVATFERFGIDLSKDQFLAAYSPDWYQTYSAVGLDREKWAAADQCWREEVSRRSPALMEGVAGVLEQLVRHLPLGIVTSGSRQRVMADLRRLEVLELFSIVVTAEDIKNPKPAPDGLLHAARLLGVSPMRILYVGDAKADFDMAAAAGSMFVGVASDFRNLGPASSEYSIHPITDLPKLVGVRGSVRVNAVS